MKLNLENKVKKFTLALIISCFATASAHAGGIGDNRYTDSDWNTSMYNWDNDYLHGQDIEWIKNNGDKSIQFTLEGGKPGIRDDQRPGIRGAKFRERNELFSDFFDRGDHIITFKFNMFSRRFRFDMQSLIALEINEAPVAKPRCLFSKV